MLEQQNSKQRLEILETLHIRKKCPQLNKVNFESSTNIFKCL